jgi:hypothetical protein
MRPVRKDGPRRPSGIKLISLRVFRNIEASPEASKGVDSSRAPETCRERCKPTGVTQSVTDLSFNINYVAMLQCFKDVYVTHVFAHLRPYVCGHVNLYL